MSAATLTTLFRYAKMPGARAKGGAVPGKEEGKIQRAEFPHCLLCFMHSCGAVTGITYMQPGGRVQCVSP